MRIAGIAARIALPIALVASGGLYADEEHSAPKVTTLMRQPLPDYPGKEGVLVAVEYPPGQDDAAHRHPGHVFVDVLEGRVEMQVEGGDARTLKPSDTF